MYLIKNKIYHICGSPYHPQSQRAVEAFNRTVQNYLYLVKDMNEDEFIPEDSILNLLLYYNNRPYIISFVEMETNLEKK